MRRNAAQLFAFMGLPLRKPPYRAFLSLIQEGEASPWAPARCAAPVCCTTLSTGRCPHPQSLSGAGTPSGAATIPCARPAIPRSCGSCGSCLNLLPALVWYTHTALVLPIHSTQVWYQHPTLVCPPYPDGFLQRFHDAGTTVRTEPYSIVLGSLRFAEPLEYCVTTRTWYSTKPLLPTPVSRLPQASRRDWAIE